MFKSFIEKQKGLLLADLFVFNIFFAIVSDTNLVELPLYLDL